MTGDPRRIKVQITSDKDVIAARSAGHTMAKEIGFSSFDVVLISTVISELARNIVRYAGRGEIVLTTSVEDKGGINMSERRGLIIVAQDEGPGIPNVELVMQEGYSTSGSLGMELPDVRQLMDDFHVESCPGRGTAVTVKKWKRDSRRQSMGASPRGSEREGLTRVTAA